MNSPNEKLSRPRRWSPLTVVALPALLVLALDPRSAAAGPPKAGKSAQSKRKAAEPAEPKLEVRKTINQIDGLTVEELEDGTTILRGPVGDQAALHGLIQRVRDLGLTLVEVILEEPDQPGDAAS